MIKKVMVSIDEDILDEFDKNLGLVPRSASITELMKQENERVDNNNK